MKGFGLGLITLFNLVLAGCASAGGGGKGMRVVRDADSLQENIESAAREAASAFGDGTLLIEKYIERPRHIEFQIMGDEHGRVIHCYEREG